MTKVEEWRSWCDPKDKEWYEMFVYRAFQFVQSNMADGLCDLGSFCVDFVGERPKKKKNIKAAIQSFGSPLGLYIVDHSQWGECIQSPPSLPSAASDKEWWAMRLHSNGYKYPCCLACSTANNQKWIVESHLTAAEHNKRRASFGDQESPTNKQMLGVL